MSRVLGFQRRVRYNGKDGSVHCVHTLVFALYFQDNNSHMNARRHAPRCWLRPLFVVATALLLTGCFWPADETESPSFTLPATFSNVPLSVGSQTYPVSRGEVVHTLAFNGVVQAGTQRELYFTVEGPVTVVHVANGDAVVPGDLLIELDSEDAALNVAVAELGYRQAELRLQQAQTGDTYALEVAQLNLEIAELRLEKIQWDPAASRDQIEVAQREVDLARAAVAQAEAGTSSGNSIDVPIAEVQLQLADLALTRAKRELAGLQLFAPITGTIRMGQDVRVGFPVKAYSPIARIVDPNSLVVESNVAADDLASLYEGMPVQLEVSFLPGVVFPGEIVALPQPFGNGSTPLTQIVPEVTNSNLNLRESASVTVRAEVGRRDDVLWLPNEAIQTVAGQTYVVVRDGDRLHDQEVEIGLEGDERTEIVAGLSEGMTVVAP